MHPAPQPFAAGSLSPAPDARTSEAQQDVGAVTKDVSAHSDMTDCQREAAIVNAGREIEEHMRQYGETGDFGERGAADAARLRMEALIRGRSAHQVARMEEQRGLR